jgi:DNA-binding NarL/FixJ family response regulator
MPTIRVILADDHTLVRSGMRALLDQLQGIEVVAEASDGRAALELVERYRPHVVLMDIAMPELNGIEAAERIVRHHPDVRVILLSMHSDEAYVTKALDVGAAGYVLKNADAAELEMAVRAVARGDGYLSPAVARHVVRGAVRRGESDTTQLTPRQREILQLIAEGASTKQIAAKLGLSVKTVETHRAKLMERLDIHDVAGLVRYAIRAGFIGPEA